MTRISPLANLDVAICTPTIQGSPYSLATTAPCEMSPPSSVTTPPNKGKYGLQPISVLIVINISPLFINSASSNLVITRQGPLYFPLDAGVPVKQTYPSSIRLVSEFNNVSSIFPSGAGTP